MEVLVMPWEQPLFNEILTDINDNILAKAPNKLKVVEMPWMEKSLMKACCSGQSQWHSNCSYIDILTESEMAICHSATPTSFW